MILNEIDYKTLLYDDRFKIDEFNVKRIFVDGSLKIKKYSFIKIKLKKLRMKIDDKLFRLNAVPAYKFLKNSENGYKEYKKYCDLYGFNNPYRNPIEYNNLILSMNNHEYEPKKGVIIINQFNVLIDGQHRACILLYKYSEEYEVKILKIHIKYQLMEYVHFAKLRLLSGRLSVLLHDRLSDKEYK